MGSQTLEPREGLELAAEAIMIRDVATVEPDVCLTNLVRALVEREIVRALDESQEMGEETDANKNA